MAYTPGQPWDSTYSYTVGQDCVYNNLSYVYWHPTIPSTVNKPPTEDVKPFMAQEPGGTGIDYRDERAWVLGRDTGININGSDIQRLQKPIRGIDPNTDPQETAYMYYQDYLSYSQLKKVFYWIGTFSDQPANKEESSWEFYSSPGSSHDYGLPNHDVDPPVPYNDGDCYYGVSPGGAGGPHPPVCTPSYDPSTNTWTFTVTYRVGGIPYAGTLQNFNRTCPYKLIVYTVVSTSPTIVEHEYNGSINSGPIRDLYFDDSTSEKDIYAYPLAIGESYVGFDFKPGSVTPPFSS